MNQNSNAKKSVTKPSTDTLNASNVSNTIDQQTDSSVTRTEEDSFIGKDKLVKQMKGQLKQFEEWYSQRDWLAFHNHHYDWWMFPIDEISSRGKAYQLTDSVIIELRNDAEYMNDLRRGVFLMVRSWGWDIDSGRPVSSLEKNQKWSYWPVRLYKAGRCMWLFQQYDYYESLKSLAYYVRDELKEKLDFFSHVTNSKADVIERWNCMEKTRNFS